MMNQQHMDMVEHTLVGPLLSSESPAASCNPPRGPVLTYALLRYWPAETGRGKEEESYGTGELQ